MHITVKGEWIFYPQKITQEKHSFFSQCCKGDRKAASRETTTAASQFCEGEKRMDCNGKMIRGETDSDIVAVQTTRRSLFRFFFQYLGVT